MHHLRRPGSAHRWRSSPHYSGHLLREGGRRQPERPWGGGMGGGGGGEITADMDYDREISLWGVRGRMQKKARERKEKKKEREADRGDTGPWI